MEPKKELKEILAIYKIAGISLAILFLIGIIYSVIVSLPEKNELPKVEEKTEETIQKNITIQNVTLNMTENITENITTNISENTTLNVTNQTTENLTNENLTQNVTITATNTTTQPTIINYTWEGIKIEFPDTLKRISISTTTHHYITITESDGTPVTNSEQFNLKFILDQAYSMDTELIPSFEGGKWLITLRPTNKGLTILKVTIACEEKKGYCQRLYPSGNIEKTFTIEVV